MPIKLKDNVSLLPLFYFAFSKQIQATETVRLFRNVYRNTSLYGPQMSLLFTTDTSSHPSSCYY